MTMYTTTWATLSFDDRPNPANRGGWPVRVTALSVTLGTATAPGVTVLSATSTNSQVTDDVDVALQSEIKLGDHVSVALGNDVTTHGIVTSVRSDATSPTGGAPSTITVEISLTDPSASVSYDESRVQLLITTARVVNALVALVDSLVAPTNEGHAVDVATLSDVHRLESVAFDPFDDANGPVQVSSRTLVAGQHVLNPVI